MREIWLPQRKPIGPVQIDWSSPWSAGLVACFEMQEGAGPIIDLVTGRRYAGTGASGTGPHVVTTPYGLARDFDLTERDYFNLASFQPKLAGKTYTGEYLCSLDAHDGTGSILMGATNEFWHQIGAPNNKVYVSGAEITVASVNRADGQYRVYHFVSDASSSAVYSDGVLLGSTGAPSVTLVAGTNFQLGRYPGGDGWDWDGRIVYARLYDRKFSAAECLARATWARYAHLKPAMQYSFKAPAAAAAYTPRMMLLGVGT